MEVSIDDLLGRDPVRAGDDIDGSQHHRQSHGDGGWGSIGSELYRQILRCQPSTLVLFELSEYAPISLKAQNPGEQCEREGIGTELAPLLGSV